MNTRTTLFLSVVALGILVYLVTVGMDSPGTNELRQRSGKVLVLESEAINRLELVNPEGSYVFGKNTAGKWFLETPVSYPVEETGIATLISELEFANRKATLEDSDLPDREKSLANFGLKPAKIQLKIREGSKTYQLILGNETVRAGTVYALINDGKKEEIAVVEKNLETMLAKGLDEWRSRKIFDFMTADVTGLNLRKDEAETELIKEGAAWKISKPLMTAADETQVASFLANLSTAVGSGFVADTAADIGTYGLSSPSLVLDVSLGDKKETIRVGSELPGETGFYYAQIAGRPTVFKINQGLYQLMAGMMDQLRDKRLFVLAPNEKLQKLKIEKGTLALDLAVKEGQPPAWEFVNSGGRPADEEKIKGFIGELQLARATAFFPSSDDVKKKNGLSKPALTVTLEIKDEKGATQQKVLQFAAAKKSEVYVDSTFRTSIMTIAESQIPALPLAPHEWYGKILKAPFAGEPDYIKWFQGKDKAVELIRGKDSVWPKELDGKILDRGILERQLLELHGLRIREWTPVTDKTFGLPYLRLTYGAGEEKRVLEFGREIEPGWRQVRVQGESLAFTVSNEVYLLLNVIPVKDEQEKAPTP